jgi:cold shock CspA family protein
MREMGEGMLRIFARMRDQDLVPPEINSVSQEFELTLHHRSVFSPKDQEWLNAYAQSSLSRDDQRVVLLGRGGNMLSTNDIMKALSIADVDEFRKLIERLRRKGVVYGATAKHRAGVKSRNDRRWAVRPPDQIEQYRSELISTLRGNVQGTIDAAASRRIAAQLSAASPYKENLQESLKLLGFVDERSRPLPSLLALLGQPALRIERPSKQVHTGNEAPTQEYLVGKVQAIKTNGYGFIEASDGSLCFFHISDLADRAYWDRMQVGDKVRFAVHGGPKGSTARQVRPESV